MLQWSTGSAKIIQKNMRLHVLSDLHQEFAPYRSSADGADVIILAGDTHMGLNGIRWAQKEFDGRQVVYIAGNHKYRRLRPRDLVPVHKETLSWLGQQLEALKGKKVVVITHHGISRQSVPDHFMGGPSQPAYTSELTEFVLGHPCRLWIHGHTHWAFDYRIGETRVLANPRGYPHETTHGFNPKLIVEV